jgi:hypothetical protein
LVEKCNKEQLNFSKLRTAPKKKWLQFKLSRIQFLKITKLQFLQFQFATLICKYTRNNILN